MVTTACLSVCLALLEANPTMSEAAEPSAAPAPSRVDFSYSFAVPHRLTVGRPDASERTLLDLQPGTLRMAWTYDDLTTYPLASFKTPPTQRAGSTHAGFSPHDAESHRTANRCGCWSRLPSVTRMIAAVRAPETRRRTDPSGNA